MSQFPEIKLGDIATIKSGFAFRSKDFGGCDYPVVKIANIKPPQVDIPSCQKISHVCLSKNQRALNFELQKGDILIAMTGATTGKIGRVPETKLRVFLNQRVGKVFLKNNNIASYDYIYYFLSQQHISYSILQQSDGSAQGNISGQQIENIKIPLPDFITQKAIAHILGTLDDKIELNKKLNQTLEDIAKAIFKSWFVDFDPVRAKAEGRPTGLPADISDLFPDELVDSDIGEIPRGWQIGTISRYAALNKKTINPSLSEEIFEHFSIPAFDDKQWPMLDKGTDIKSSKTLVPKGALLVSKLNPNTPRVWLPKKKNTYKQICSTEFMVLTPSPMGDIMFLWGMFTSNCIADRMTAMVTGTSKSHQRVKPTDVLNIKIPAPGEKLVKAFSDAVKPMLEKTLIGKSESEILVELRDTLLPKLISGELRIPDAERFIATIDDAPSA